MSLKKEDYEKLLAAIKLQNEQTRAFLEAMDENVKKTATFQKMFSDDVIPRFIKKMTTAEMMCQIEVDEYENVKNMTPQEKGLYFLVKGAAVKSKQV